MEAYKYMKYDYLMVGSGLYSAVFAHEAAKEGKKVLLVDAVYKTILGIPSLIISGIIVFIIYKIKIKRKKLQKI